MINNLLELQELEATARPVVWVDIALNELLSQVIVAFQERARSHEQHLQMLVPPTLPVFVSDPEILSRILTELLMAACKYTPPKGTITVSVEVEPAPTSKASTRQQEETVASSLQVVQLIVCNSGAEIPADELPRIFDKFYRIPTSDRWQQGGTGLGLALVKRSVIHLGGAIRAESYAGQTRFIIEFPLAPSGG